MTLCIKKKSDFHDDRFLKFCHLLEKELFDNVDYKNDSMYDIFDSNAILDTFNQKRKFRFDDFNSDLIFNDIPTPYKRNHDIVLQKKKLMTCSLYINCDFFPINLYQNPYHCKNLYLHHVTYNNYKTFDLEFIYEDVTYYYEGFNGMLKKISDGGKSITSLCEIDFELDYKEDTLEGSLYSASDIDGWYPLFKNCPIYYCKPPPVKQKYSIDTCIILKSIEYSCCANGYLFQHQELGIILPVQKINILFEFSKIDIYVYVPKKKNIKRILVKNLDFMHNISGSCEIKKYTYDFQFIKK